MTATPITAETKGYAKAITYFGQASCVCCDGKCNKAWGINSRPKVQLSDDEDDYAYLADDELGEAPANPGTYEGGHGKPTTRDELLNKWCVRECERSEVHPLGVLSEVRDFSQRRYNMRDDAGRFFDEPPPSSNSAS